MPQKAAIEVVETKSNEVVETFYVKWELREAMLSLLEKLTKSGFAPRMVGG
jgi:hypothetical protein